MEVFKIENVLKRIEEKISAPLKKENILVDKIYFGEEDGVKTLFITVDSDINDLDMCVKATNIINPIVDELNLISDEYVLDISGKVSDSSEC